MADNKVKFLRGTSNEYAVAEKDSDTIYFTTDDGKLYIGDKEVSGDGSVTIDDTLSDTSTNPVQNKIIKQAIDNKADKSLYGDTTINVGRKADTTIGSYSTAEGYDTTAKGVASHAEGVSTTASGDYSHSEGVSTTAKGVASHAEGLSTTAKGVASHAEGDSTTASGDYSHAGGSNTKALKEAEVAYGKYNESNDDTLFSIGDGTANDARHNAFEITTTGGKLHDKDIATTDNIPTSLPANGGNADQIKVRQNIVRTETAGLTCYNYETSASYTEQYEIPTPYVDVLRLMYNSDRGIEIAVNWNIGTRRIWVRGNHSGWSDWTLINYPYVTGTVSGTSGTSTDINDLGFTPSFVICGTSSSAFIPTIITGGFRFTPTATTTYKYIAFR